MEIWHLEWGDGELTYNIIEWKFPLVQGKGVGNGLRKVWGIVQEGFGGWFR